MSLTQIKTRMNLGNLKADRRAIIHEVKNMKYEVRSNPGLYDIDYMRGRINTKLLQLKALDAEIASHPTHLRAQKKAEAQQADKSFWQKFMTNTL